MLSHVAKGTLRLAIVTAREFAEDGRLVAGYDCLMTGLRAARAASECGKPLGRRADARLPAGRGRVYRALRSAHAAGRRGRGGIAIRRVAHR